MREDLKKVFFESLLQEDNNKKISFRRATGIMLKDAPPETILSFYQTIPPYIKQYEENKWFFAICVACLNDPERVCQPFPVIAAEYKRRFGSNLGESYEHRFANLLDTRWEEDGFLISKLARFIKMVEHQGFAVAPDHLLKSLELWNAPSRIVQKEWAKLYSMSLVKEEENAD